jgi:DNA-binding transcriptional regulator YhcF (GntR family)
LKKTDQRDFISIDSSLAMPIYKQIIQSTYHALERGSLKQGDLMPSVNAVVSDFSIARGSVFTAYNEMRAAGIIDSIPGKGYFVKTTVPWQRHNIFLLFSTFTPYKEILYNALIDNLSGMANVDIYFHHHNIKVFENLIREHAAYYNTFVIMPEIHERTLEILEALDQKKIYLLDVGLKPYGEAYPGVFQDFENDIYRIFSGNIDLFRKYNNISLIYSGKNKNPDIVRGFRRFIDENAFSHEIISSASFKQVSKQHCYVVIDDNDLVSLVKKINEKGWALGQEVGVISYNESELKSVIASGITTITTDFRSMGKRMADMILSGDRSRIENPFLMVRRKSV